MGRILRGSSGKDMLMMETILGTLALAGFTVGIICVLALIIFEPGSLRDRPAPNHGQIEA